MDVPVVAAAGLKGHVGGKQAAFRVGEGIEERIPDKILRVGRVGRAGAEHIGGFECFSVFIFHGKCLLDFFTV